MKFAFKHWVGLTLTLGALWFQSTYAQHVHPPQSKLNVQVFDENTWKMLLQTGPRPAAYLFTTSYCSTCPDAFSKIQAEVARTGKKIPLAAVMMDVSGKQALRHANHFKGLSLMYAFDGYEPAIRESVDPNWPNVTPYVVLIDQNGHLQRFIGPPSQMAFKKWLS